MANLDDFNESNVIKKKRDEFLKKRGIDPVMCDGSNYTKEFNKKLKYDENREMYIQKSKNYYKSHRVQILKNYDKDKKKAYYKKNREKIIEKSLSIYYKNRDKILAKAKEKRNDGKRVEQTRVETDKYNIVFNYTIHDDLHTIGI